MERVTDSVVDPVLVCRRVALLPEFVDNVIGRELQYIILTSATFGASEGETISIDTPVRSKTLRRSHRGAHGRLA